MGVHLKNEEKVDDYFNAVLKKYGLYVASRLLPACSSAIILKYLKLYKIEITARNLLFISYRHLELIEDIFDALNMHQSSIPLADKYKIVFKHIAKKNPHLFLKLAEKYKVSLCLGWRLTDKFVQTEKENVINNPKKFLDLCHKRQIVKTLKDDFRFFYANLFPESMSDFETNSNELYSLISHLSSDAQKVTLLVSTFMRIYGCSIWDHPKFVTLQLLELLPADERNTWVSSKDKPSGICEEKWWSYLKTSNSFPLLKKNLMRTSDPKCRLELIGYLVDTCKINKDKDNLAQLCKYMVAQHRNDHISVRVTFLRKIHSNFKLGELIEEHWLPINELLQIFKLNGEYFSMEREFLTDYIHYRLLHQLPVEEQLIQLAKMQPYTYNILKYDSRLEKHCLLTLLKVDTNFTEEGDKDVHFFNNINAIVDWNKRHPGDIISISSLISDKRFLEKIPDKRHLTSAIVKYYLKQKNHHPLTSELFKICFKEDYIHNVEDIINWLTKHKPLVVVEYLNVMVSAMLRSYYNWEVNTFLHMCSKYSHLDIPQNLIKHCLRVIDDPINENGRKNAITMLACIMDSHEFLNWISSYYPSDVKADMNKKEDQLFIQVQYYIASNLKNISPPSLAFESLLKFCQGDFLKFAITSLYSAVFNAAENKLAQFFERLTDKPVSVRKHAIHLTLTVLSQEHVHKVLPLLIKSEKNYTVRKYIFKGITKFFMKNPEDHLWQLFKVCVESSDLADKETFETFLLLIKAPLRYKVDYIQFAWEVLKKVPERDGEIESAKGNILNSVSSDIIILLPKYFCSTVILQLLFNFNVGSSLQCAVMSFAIKYILSCPSKVDQEECLCCIFSLLKNYIATHNSSLTIVMVHDNINKFITNTCDYFMKEQFQNVEILNKFVALWNESLKPHEFFSEYLYLQFTLIYVQSLDKKLRISEAASKIALFYDDCVNIYDASVCNLFFKIFNNQFLKLFLKIEGNELKYDAEYVFIDGLIKATSTNCLLFVISILPPRTTKTEKRFDAVFQMLRGAENSIVQIHLNEYIKNM